MRRLRTLLVSELLLVPLLTGLGAHATSAVVIPSCTTSNLSLAVGPMQAAAGNVAMPIVITNRGAVACSLYGYPTLSLVTKATIPRPLKVSHLPQSQIYRSVTPQHIVIAPHHVASFGISYVDGANQQYGNRPGCLVVALRVTLPALRPSTTFVLRGTWGQYGLFNICFTRFTVGVTPLQLGSTPREH